MRVLMISGDVDVIRNIDGPFSLTLRELSTHWKKIDVLCPGMTTHRRKFKDNVSLIGVRKFLLIFDLLKILRSNKYDLVVTHDYGLMLNGLSAFWALRFYQIPQISEIHHLEGYPIFTNMKEMLYSIWGKIYIRYFVRRMSGVRVDNMGSIVNLLLDLGVPEEKIIYLPPIYLDLEIYKPLTDEKVFDLLFVGRLAQNKGIFTILEAVKYLKDKGHFFRTNIKGRGPLRDKVLSYIKNNQLENLVTLDERILNESQLVHLYNQSKVLVCASTVEGGPRVTIEAMACNIPVISTSCGIMPEVIEPGKNGIIFDGTYLDLVRALQNIQDLDLKSIRDSVSRFNYKQTLSNYALRYVKHISKS